MGGGAAKGGGGGEERAGGERRGGGGREGRACGLRLMLLMEAIAAESTRRMRLHLYLLLLLLWLSMLKINSVIIIPALQMIRSLAVHLYRRAISRPIHRLRPRIRLLPCGQHQAIPILAVIKCRLPYSSGPGGIGNSCRGRRRGGRRSGREERMILWQLIRIHILRPSLLRPRQRHSLHPQRRRLRPHLPRRLYLHRSRGRKRESRVVNCSTRGGERGGKEEVEGVAVLGGAEEFSGRARGRMRVVRFLLLL